MASIGMDGKAGNRKGKVNMNMTLNFKSPPQNKHEDKQGYKSGRNSSGSPVFEKNNASLDKTLILLCGPGENDPAGKARHVRMNAQTAKNDFFNSEIELEFNNALK